MAVASELLSILNQLKTSIDGLGLMFNDAPVPVQIKKFVQWLQNLQLPSLPIILISREDSPYSVTPWSTENEVLAKYKTVIAVIGPGNRDNTANMDVWLAWDKEVRRLFQWGLQPTIASCFFSKVTMNPSVLRSASFKNYDVSGMEIEFWNVEARTN